MGRHKKPVEISDTGGVLRFASVALLEDGRVEAVLADDRDHPVKQLIGRTTQPEAAKFIMNDLCPEALAAVSDDEGEEVDGDA